MAQRPRPVLLVLLFALTTTPLVAAPAVTITPDRIYTGHGNREFIPRFASYLPKVLVVAAGETVTLPADSTWDAIEVAGTLRVARDRDTIVRFIHLTILPGGRLDAGTAADPILANAWFIIRDVPIDLVRDPYQFGNGIINLGRRAFHGRAVTPLALLQSDARGGATLSLAAPADWRIGDELLIPDTQQLGGRGVAMRRESRVFISGKTATSVTLSKPLDFEHHIPRTADNRAVPVPVLNLTRNIVVVSENPHGTRGHTIDLGHHASWDNRYYVLDGLGRTLNVALDNTTAGPDGAILHVGTNQVARYSEHKHHTHGHGSLTKGAVLHGTKIAKWGHVVHVTSDSVVEDSIALDFPGAGFSTEDGPELRNVFRGNFAAFATGNGRGTQQINPSRGNCPGCEGAGFWFHGVEQTIERNYAFNNAIGFNYVQIFQVLAAKVPSVPGGPPDTDYDPRKVGPISLADNVAVSNALVGHEYWGNPWFDSVRHTAAHNGRAQILQGQASGRLRLIDPFVLAQGGRSFGVSSSEAYTSGLEVFGGEMVGCYMGFSRGLAAGNVVLKDLAMQCVRNIFLNGYPNSLYAENVTFKPYHTFPLQTFVFPYSNPQNIWQVGDQIPGGSSESWVPADGTRFVVKNYNGTGKDYRLFETAQLANQPATPSGNRMFFCPVDGLTMGECWAQFGLAYGREPLPEAEAVTLEGVVNGFGREGLGPVVLGPPRAVPVTTTSTGPVVVRDNGTIRVRLAITGEPAGSMTGRALVQFDDGAPFLVQRRSGQRPWEISFNSPLAAAAPGMHTITTWRLTTGGSPIPASALKIEYFVE